MGDGARLMKSCRGLLCSLVVALGLTGCGLSEYQSKMDAQRVRVLEFDATNSLLDDPLEMVMQPTKGEKGELQPAWPFDFYLRLPRGFTLNKTPYYQNFSFYRFAGNEPGYNLFIVAALVAEPSPDAKVEPKEKFGEYIAKNFHRYVRGGIDDYYFKTYKSDANFRLNASKLFLPSDEKMKYEKITVKMFTAITDFPTKIVYDYIAYSDKDNKEVKDHSAFRVYFHEEGGKQFCLVVQRPLRLQNEAFDKSIEACLGTLDITADAANKRAQYKKAKNRS
jgi:hypothetical protein